MYFWFSNPGKDADLIMTNINNTIDELSENIILNGVSLFNYYVNVYKNYFFRSDDWKQDKEVINLVKFFENICLSGIKKFRFLSIIQFDIDAFKSIMNMSNILSNDEELVEYLTVLDNIHSKLDHCFCFLRDNEKDITKLMNENEMLKKDLKDLTYKTNRLKSKGFIF